MEYLSKNYNLKTFYSVYVYGELHLYVNLDHTTYKTNLNCVDCCIFLNVLKNNLN
jgi:hypothetical protein